MPQIFSKILYLVGVTFCFETILCLQTFVSAQCSPQFEMTPQFESLVNQFVFNWGASVNSDYLPQLGPNFSSQIMQVEVPECQGVVITSAAY